MKAKTPKEEEYLTKKEFGAFRSVFDKAMTGIAQSFDRIDKKFKSHDKSFELIMTELKAIRHDNQHIKQTMSAVQRASAGYDHRLDNHELRIEKLEVHA